MKNHPVKQPTHKLPALITNSISRRMPGALFCMMVSLAVTHATAAPRPNVVFIMPDDLSYDDYSAFNPDGPRTPNVDSLGLESVRLTDFHVSPTCSPSRAAFMTGRYSNSTGAWHTILGRQILWENEVTMADIFKTNGYSTAIFSKWHLGENYPFRPKDRGFEHTAMFLGGGIDQQPHVWGSRNNPPSTLYIDEQPVELTKANGAMPGATGAFATDFFTTQAIACMEKNAAEKKPFFVYLPYNVAHLPHDMPADARPGVSAHTATVENMDQNIGRIIKYLDQSGLADNTVLVMVLGDNGVANSRYRGDKATSYEAGHRVPCYIRWKNGGFGGSPETAGEVSDLTANIDFLPTFMDMLGLHDVSDRPAEVPIQGKSFRALWDTKADNTAKVRAEFTDRIVVVDNQREDALIKYKEACIMHSAMDSKGNITRQWRLILPSKDGKPVPEELYDVQADPNQKENLIANPEHSELVAKLKTAYESWWETVRVHADEYARPVLGSKEESEVCLFAHDWHTEVIPPWNHKMIAAGPATNGYNAVTFESAGDYTFDLRRWPKEIAGETTVSSELQTPVRVGDASPDGTIKVSKGKALPIRSARIRIWNGDKTYADEKQEIAPDSDGAVFTIPSLPAGPAMVQTWFYDADGNELCGAYYNYTNRL